MIKHFIPDYINTFNCIHPSVFFYQHIQIPLRPQVFPRLHYLLLLVEHFYWVPTQIICESITKLIALYCNTLRFSDDWSSTIYTTFVFFFDTTILLWGGPLPLCIIYTITTIYIIITNLLRYNRLPG